MLEQTRFGWHGNATCMCCDCVCVCVHACVHACGHVCVCVTVMWVALAPFQLTDNGSGGAVGIHVLFF